MQGPIAVDPSLAGPRGMVLGIDEAGRGSLVGPLVVGGFLCDRAVLEHLRALGARDSKLLSPGQRTAAYQRLRKAGRAASITLPPPLVDRYVAKGRLNELEAEAFARLVALASPEEVFLDACDPNAERFGRRVHALSGGTTTVRASHQADRRIPVVGAASIVAKVRRDRAIERLARRLGPEVGSGYPSDPRTVAFVRTVLQAGGPCPRWVRRSWATTGRLMREIQVRPLERFAP